jgi:5-methylcytosine-specific restriction enzyme subunit McrC
MSASRLSVFEHQTIHVGQELSAAQFDALVRLNDRSKDRLFDIGHRRITFRQFVGYLQVGDLGIEVLPKADRGGRPGDAGTWHAFLLEMLRTAMGLRLHAASPASQQVSRASLLDVLAFEFAEEATSLTRSGLAKGYRSHEANEPTFRGKLLVAENIRANLGRADRTYSRFTVFDAETTLNRLLLTTLDALTNVTLSPVVGDAVRRATAAMPALPLLLEVHGLFERVHLGRSTARYANALLLARMILEQQMPRLRSGETTVFSLMFDMNVLWERYVVAVFRRAARSTPIAVDAQSTRPFWRAAGMSARTIRPDIILRDKGRPSEAALVVDTKWKRLEPGGPKDADLRQMFVYGELLRCERAMLLYPAAGGEPRHIEGRFERGRRCDAVEVALVELSGSVGTAAIAQQLSRLVGASQVSVAAARPLDAAALRDGATTVDTG